MASSAMEATSGTVRMPTPMPAAARLNCVAWLTKRWTSSGEMNVRAKNPRTTLGMPARTSRMGLRMRRTRGRAYSDRYTAAPRPRGAATSMATKVTTRLPMKIVLMS